MLPPICEKLGIDVYKKGAILEATISKYLMILKWIEKLASNLTISNMTRSAYQQLLNVVDDGLLRRDPTRKAIIKGKIPKAKK